MKYILIALTLISCAGEPQFRKGDQVYVKELPNRAIFSNCSHTGLVKWLGSVALYTHSYSVVFDGCFESYFMSESDLQFRDIKRVR